MVGRVHLDDGYYAISYIGVNMKTHIQITEGKVIFLIKILWFILKKIFFLQNLQR